MQTLSRDFTIASLNRVSRPMRPETPIINIKRLGIIINFVKNQFNLIYVVSLFCLIGKYTSLLYMFRSAVLPDENKMHRKQKQIKNNNIAIVVYSIECIDLSFR